MLKSIYIAQATALMMLCGSSLAAPIQWVDNGHWYDRISKNNLVNTWDFARNDAEGQTFIDPNTGETLIGHLATITSAGENQFLMDNWGYEGWLGGYQTPDSPTTDSGWNWVTGEAWDYTNWSALEPNDQGPSSSDTNGGNEDNGENALLLWNTGYWNDWDENSKTSFYYVEFEPVAAVPVPAAAWLFGSGLIGLIGVARKKG